jgi:hypothetical protein
MSRPRKFYGNVSFPRNLKKEISEVWSGIVGGECAPFQGLSPD